MNPFNEEKNPKPRKEEFAQPESAGNENLVPEESDLDEPVDGIILKYLKKYRQSTGSTCIEKQHLCQDVLNEICDSGSVTNPSIDMVNSTLSELVLRESIKAFEIGGEEYCYTAGDYYNESTLIEQLKRCMMATNTINPTDNEVAAALEAVLKEDCISMPDEQIRAVKLVICSNVSIVTGGPGCGKTFLTKVIIKTIQKLMPNAKIRLAATTAKAAQRLEAATGMFAETVHSMVDYRKMRNYRVIPDSISADLVVVDEVSMLTLYIAQRLFKMITPQTKVILVGDPNQLPSIEPGDVLSDLLNSGTVKVANLCTCHRQISTSREIASLANAVKTMQKIAIFPFPLRSTLDCPVHYVQEFFVGKVHNEVINTVKNLHDDLGYSYDDIQVISPTNTGYFGTDALNIDLSNLVNPRRNNKAEFWPGDRVVCNRNILDKDNRAKKTVVNGEVGEVVSVSGKDIEVQFGDKRMTLTASRLTLAYAVTVHKAQGSEYKVVVLALHQGMGAVLSRSLLYTALTRAKEKIVVVGTVDAVMKAITDNRDGERVTLLSQRLKNELKSIA
ncbi:MAG: ATP-dependent RecD-like DNA helicase [Roseburia sp.]|nr:ATP-dependent RecD-like DNA helicase [Lachnospiraceae bacterium]MCM1568888.1 ATP-dependent RecD-like DNA helicase [Roseburia sp.]